MRGFRITKALKFFQPAERPIIPHRLRKYYYAGRKVPAQMEPFGHKLFRGISLAHERCLSRTVMVKDNDVESSMRLLNRLLNQEGILGIMRRSRHREKPFEQRNRLACEFSKGVYDEDMQRKLKFIMRKNRADPYPGLY